MFRAIWRIITGTRKCTRCNGNGYVLIPVGKRQIRQSCTHCRKSGRVKR